MSFIGNYFEVYFVNISPLLSLSLLSDHIAASGDALTCNSGVVSGEMKSYAAMDAVALVTDNAQIRIRIESVPENARCDLFMF